MAPRCLASQPQDLENAFLRAGRASFKMSTTVKVKWGKQRLSVTASTVGELRAELQRQTGIATHRQKLLGGAKVKLNDSDDGVLLSGLNIRKPIMLMGTPEAELAKASGSK